MTGGEYREEATRRQQFALNIERYAGHRQTRRLVAIVIKGLNGPITVKGVKYPGAIPLIPVDTQFPQFKDNQKLADVLNYIRTSWSNKADAAIVPDFIQKVRDEFKERTMPWTEAEVINFPTPKQ